MRQLLITIAAVVLVGCGESQHSAPAPEAPTGKASDISMHDAVGTGNIEAVKQHIAAGMDVNAKHDAFGITSLEIAAIAGHKEIVELLISEGADVNAKDKKGRTPLHHAATHGRKEIVELLIAKGADVNAKTEGGITPLDWAKRHPEIATLLRKHGGKTTEELKAASN